MKVNLTEDLQQKWAPVLNVENAAPIGDLHRRSVVATLLENVENALAEETRQTGVNQTLLGEAAPVNQTGSEIDNFDPVMISLVRRTMPNLMAYDVCGVQAMTGPTQLIFAMRSRYTNQTGTEALFNEADTTFSSLTSGANTFGQKHVGGYPAGDINTYNTGTGMATANAEAIGTSGAPAIPEMAFSIEKVSVTAKSRTLKAEYTIELAQDLKAIHGLNAETELSNILTGEILTEINREVIRTIGITAVPGAATDVTTAGTFDFDTDSNGRWMQEKFIGLLFQVEREANAIAKATRRGKGNIIICSSDVASALALTGKLEYAPKMPGNGALEVDDTGNTFAGVLNGKFKVFVDPYATGNYMVVGYKGSSAFDAGLFYCPYVPLQMLRAVDQGSFQPKIGFKTRYGMVANPFAEGTNAGLGALTKDTNVYYRRVLVNNIM
jgi:hypothetical protein